ncbi:MAG: hypothetical protein HY279_02650 [Nitrospinae bacterium]|nr:hypothetical protein [Nitrospinota bacterium]
MTSKKMEKTSKEVIFNADTSKENSFNSFYVAITRGKEDVRVYTDSKENLKGQVKEGQIKTSTLDHDKEFQTDKLSHQINKIADEYSKASERVDEIGERLEQGDKSLTEKEILDATNNLKDAGEKFDNLGWEIER